MHTLLNDANVGTAFCFLCGCLGQTALAHCTYNAARNYINTFGGNERYPQYYSLSSYPSMALWKFGSRRFGFQFWEISSRCCLLIEYHVGSIWKWGSKKVSFFFFGRDTRKITNNNKKCASFNCSCSRFYIFITTHSNPTTGFLHMAPGNCGSIPVSEVLFFLKKL